MKTYIDEVVERVRVATGVKSKETLKVYSLLVLIKGEDISLEDVHDAWSVMMNFKPYNPPYLGHEHPSIVPFDQFSYETQQKDKKYADALIQVAKEMNEQKKHKDHFSEEWDKKFGPPADHDKVPAEEFLKRLKEMSTFTPPE